MLKKRGNVNVPRVGLTPTERDLLAGMVYVLVDSRSDNLHDHVIGVFDSPTKAIATTHTDPGLWHHYHEHYWMGGGGKWEVTPFMLNDEVEWKRKEWEEARPRMEQFFGKKVVAERVLVSARTGELAKLSPGTLTRIEHLDLTPDYE